MNSIILSLEITKRGIRIGPSMQRQRMKTSLFWQKEDTWKGQWVGKMHSNSITQEFHLEPKIVTKRPKETLATQV